MDIRSILTSLPSRVEKDIYVREAGRSKENFATLLELVFHENDPVAWRAAWFMDSSDEQYPGLVEQFIAVIIQELPELKSTGALRSLLRMLSRYTIPEEEQGLLIDLCFGYMVSELYPVAVKVHAMQIIYNHALIYPELKEELRTIIEDQTENNSVGFMARGQRIIKQLDKL
jgi:hypothetical protein